jgi:hypothetical protein
MAQVQISDEHIPHLLRLSREYNVELTRLVNLIIAIGIETLDEAGEDEPIGYVLDSDVPDWCKQAAAKLEQFLAPDPDEIRLEELFDEEEW